jgi:hypothetical protein
VRAQDFIAGLLYSASPAGETIRYPLNHVLALLERGGRENGAGSQTDAFQRLAAREPAYLVRQIRDHLDGVISGDTNWRTAMTGADPARLRALAGMLGMEMRGDGEIGAAMQGEIS